MNRDFACRVLQVLERYDVLQPGQYNHLGKNVPDDIEISGSRYVEEDVEGYLSRHSIIRLMDLLQAWVPGDRWVWYDYEFYENGILTNVGMVKRFADATGEEWVPERLRETSEQRADTLYELVDFSFKGQAFHWEFRPSYGMALQELNFAIHDFARHHLSGNFVDAGGVFDQCTNYCYLPHGAIAEIRDLLQQIQRTWPTSDELISFFRQKKEERDDWVSSMGALIQQSDFLHVNELSERGERPLHVAVQEVLRGNLDESVLAYLIGDYDARPSLVDADGRTAFDYALGNEELISKLRISFTGKWFPIGKKYQDAEWYLPIGYYSPPGPVF